MSNPFEHVAKFMAASDQHPSEETAELYLKLIAEEIEEFYDGINNDDAVETLDGLLDAIFVMIAYAYARGWDPLGGWNEVARSNLDKIDQQTGKVLKRADGKVLKPEGWRGPDLREFVNGND